MRFFPKVTSPCPYKGPLSDIMDGDICRLCKHEVHDLTGMAEEAKRALLEGCSDEVCVTYRIDIRPALAAMAVGAGVMAPTALAAQDAETGAQFAENYAAEEWGDGQVIIVGGARRASSDWQSERDIRQAHPRRTLPVVYEDKPARRDQRSSGTSGKSSKRT